MVRPSGQGTGTAKLLGDVLSQAVRILRLEAALAGREVSDGVRQAGCALALLAIGAALGLVALIVLAGASVAALVAFGLGVAWAALLVGLVAALSAGILIAAGLHWLDPDRLVPHRAIANVKRDIEVLRERIDARA